METKERTALKKTQRTKEISADECRASRRRKQETSYWCPPGDGQAGRFRVRALLNFSEDKGNRYESEGRGAKEAKSLETS